MATTEQSPPPRSALSPTQISQFLNHINLPPHLHQAAPSLHLLRTLHTHMLITCPYENLSLHYNPTHRTDLDPQAVFHKIVTAKAGRGGYCMELAILYNHLLRGLGFDAYTVGVRTRPRIDGVPQGDFPGWCHIVSIVTLPSSSDNEQQAQRYAVDVAFGGDGPTAPLPLVDGGPVHQNLGAQEVRLVRDWAPTQTYRVEASKMWIYQYRNGRNKDWNSYYGFTETEFMAADWNVINYWANTCPDFHQTRTVLIVRFLGKQKERGDKGEWEIYGKRMLSNSAIKENLGGRTQLIAECRSEAERVKALEVHFNIVLDAAQISSNKGRLTDLDIAT